MCGINHSHKLVVPIHLAMPFDPRAATFLLKSTPSSVIDFVPPVFKLVIAVFAAATFTSPPSVALVV